MACIRAGHDVVFGLRPGSSSTADVVKEGGVVVTVDEACTRPIVVVAVPFSGLRLIFRHSGCVGSKVGFDAELKHFS